MRMSGKEPPLADRVGSSEIQRDIVAMVGLYDSLTSSFRGDAIASNYDVQLHIGESRDSGSGPSDHPGMTATTTAPPSLA
jgi:hypothetical protein